MANKTYRIHSLVEDPSIFSGYLLNYVINDSILSRLAKDLGFSLDLYETLSKLNKDTADSLVVSTSRKNEHPEIAFLVDEDNSEVLGYTLTPERLPLLNIDFMKRVSILVDSTDSVELDDAYMCDSDTIASVIIKKSGTINIDSDKYEVGVLLCNNELENTYARLVVYVGGQPIYLPASYYNLSSNRYKKSTSNSAEALEVLVLRIIDDIRENEISDILDNFNRRYKFNVSALTTYEEYNTLLRTVMRIPSIIDDRSFLDNLNTKYEEYEQKYSHIEDQKSSYIWRCTAIGDLTIGALVHMTIKILNDLCAPSIEYFAIRELLGNYLSTNRISDEIAKES